ncbi:MAG TPA: PAS domain S-box protein, partial [Blastocatellia bacterium]
MLKATTIKHEPPPVPASEAFSVSRVVSVNDLPVGILVFDQQARVIAQNRRCQELLNGISLMGGSLLDLNATFQYDEKTPVPMGQCPVRGVITSRRPVDNITIVLHGPAPSGDRWLLMSASPTISASGELREVVCSVHDISRLKRATSSRQEWPVQLNTVIEQMAESIVITDARGIIQYVNTHFQETTGWSSSDVKGLNFLTVGGQTSKLRFYKEAMDALSAGKTWRGVHTARRKNGSSYEEEMSISPVWDADGKLVNCIAVSRDVTEKKQLEAVAEAVNMAENVGYVFSGIRHELGNPINSI